MQVPQEFIVHFRDVIRECKDVTGHMEETATFLLAGAAVTVPVSVFKFLIPRQVASYFQYILT